MKWSLVVVCALAAPVSAEPCPPMANYPHALTRADTEIVDGGGIVVGALPERDDGKPDPRGAVADWKFNKKAAVVTHLAPGLDVVAASAAGTLASKDGDAQVAVKHAAKTAPILVAPAVSKIERYAPERVKHPYVETVAQLSGDPPASAIAIVVFDKAGKVGRSWGSVAANQKDLHIYTSGGCAPLPDGTVDSKVDDEITLAWVDSSGRLSKLSAPIKVQKK